MIVTSVNLELMELGLEGSDLDTAQLTLIVTDTDEKSYRLVFGRNEIAELAECVRAFQDKFPGILGGH